MKEVKFEITLTMPDETDPRPILQSIERFALKEFQDMAITQLGYDTID